MAKGFNLRNAIKGGILGIIITYVITLGFMLILLTFLFILEGFKAFEGTSFLEFIMQGWIFRTSIIIGLIFFIFRGKK